MLIVNYLMNTFWFSLYRAVGKVRENFTADLIQAEVDIRLRHPLLSLVKPWMDKQLREVKVKIYIRV